MNRPNKEDYSVIEYTRTGAPIKYYFDEKYTKDLEKYCDELEKALNKACLKLEAVSFAKDFEEVKEWTRLYGVPVEAEKFRRVFEEEVENERD